MDHGVRRFIGRRFDASIGVAGGFVPTGEVTEVPATPEYIRCLRDGDLEPADEATRALAGAKLHVAPPAPAVTEVLAQLAAIGQEGVQELSAGAQALTALATAVSAHAPELVADTAPAADEPAEAPPAPDSAA
jgi:hypothetical protein